MANPRSLSKAFSGGVISPEMFGHIDDAKYQAGLEQCENWKIKPQGPVLKREGSSFVREVKTSAKKTRVIPFTYSITQTTTLEFGENYIRFHTNGATVIDDTPTNTISNPDFATNITGWTATASGSSTAPARVAVAGFDGAIGVARFIANLGQSTLTRTLTGLTIGLSYTVKFAVSYPGGFPGGMPFFWATTFVGTVDVSAGNPGTYYLTFVASATSHTLQFQAISTYPANSAIDLAYAVFGLTGSAGVPIEIATTYLESELFDIHYVQSGDVLTLVHPAHPPAELRRYSALNWVLADIQFTPTLLPPAPTIKGNGKGSSFFYQYVVTSIDTANNVESVASPPGQGASFDITAITQANPMVITTASAHGLSVGQPCYIDSISGMVELNGNYYVVAAGSAGTTLKLNYGDDSDNFNPASGTGTGTTVAGTAVDSTAFNAYASGGKVYRGGVKNNLFINGAKNTISWTPVSGADKYNVYKFSGGLYGYIGQATGGLFIDDNIAPDLGKTPPIYDTVFNAAGEYPSAVSYYEQRRMFAGSINKPFQIWATKSGTESVMAYTLPVHDDDRISVRVAAREANSIRHIVPLSQLMLLTSAAEWRVTSVNSDAITPTSISVKPQSYIGSNNVQPVIINTNMIYVAARGGHVRECSYNWQANGFITGDLSLRAADLFDNLDISDMAYSKAPYPVIWMISSNGQLLGLTYIPEQQVGAWHVHTTDGQFESVCVVAEGSADVLYAVVKRTINGSSKRYIERFNPAIDNTYYVDCGLTYTGAPATTISGLTHLEGKTVSILADGAVHPQRTVSGGAITLQAPASTVIIGLPITSTLKPLPLVTPTDNAYGMGRPKNINRVWLRMRNASAIQIGPDTNDLYTYTPNVIGGKTVLATALVPAWTEDGQFVVIHTDPLPATITSMTYEYTVGGG